MSLEKEIQKFAIDAIRDIGVFCMRLNSGKVRVKGGFMTLCPEGTADVVAFPDNSLPVWVELKQKTGEQRKKQVEFAERVTALGHRYHVVKSIDDVMTLLPTLR